MTGGSAGTVITGSLIMGALAYKATDLVKYLVALIRLVLFERRPGPDANRIDADQKVKDWENAVSGAWDGLVTLLVGCAAGIGVVFVMANTTWSDEIQFGNHTLKTLPSTSLVVLGLTITALAALLFDAKKAIDRTDTASTPKLSARADKTRRARVRALLGPTDANVIERQVESALLRFRAGGDALEVPATKVARTD